MTVRADMVIFHAPAALEFASKGKSIGTFDVWNAKTLFETTQNNIWFVGACAVDELYRAVIAICENQNTDKEPL